MMNASAGLAAAVLNTSLEHDVPTKLAVFSFLLECGGWRVYMCVCMCSEQTVYGRIWHHTYVHIDKRMDIQYIHI